MLLTGNQLGITIKSEAANQAHDFRKDCDNMNMTEVARLLLGLRAAGWSEKEINDFVLYIESGEEQYKPKPRDTKKE